jgi:hypothetical protein
MADTKVMVAGCGSGTGSSSCPALYGVEAP